MDNMKVGLVEETLVFFCWWLAFSRIRCDIRDTRGGDQAAREQTEN